MTLRDERHKSEREEEYYAGRGAADYIQDLEEYEKLLHRNPILIRGSRTIEPEERDEEIIEGEMSVEIGICFTPVPEWGNGHNSRVWGHGAKWGHPIFPREHHLGGDAVDSRRLPLFGNQVPRRLQRVPSPYPIIPHGYRAHETNSTNFVPF